MSRKKLKKAENALGRTAANLYAHVNKLIRRYANGERHLRPEIDQMQAAADTVGILASAARKERKGG